MSEEHSVPALEAFGNDPSIWSELNLRDVQSDATTSPSMETLIERNVRIIEGHMLDVMRWRKVLIGSHLQRFGKPPNSGHRHNMSHAERPDDVKESTCNSNQVMNTNQHNEHNEHNSNPKNNTTTNNNLTKENIHINRNTDLDADTPGGNGNTTNITGITTNSTAACSCTQGNEKCSPGKAMRDISQSSAETPFLFIEDETVDSLPENVKSELILFVRTIASRYNKVLYHNFEHASHVTASVNQLISMLHDGSTESVSRRSSEVTTSSSISASSSMSLREVLCTRLPTSSEGFIFNPMVHLALVVTALTHDVEHQGVGNRQLVEEGGPLAVKYKGNSVAENNSFDVSNEILCEEQYRNLRECMFGINDSNLNQALQDATDGAAMASLSSVRTDFESYKALFHQISHDVIMATDISCPRRLAEGKEKWIQSFEQYDQASDTLSSASAHRCDGLDNLNDEREAGRMARRSSFPPVGRMFRKRCPRRASAPHKYTVPTEFIADPFPDQTKLPQLERNFNSRVTKSVRRPSRQIRCPLCNTSSTSDDAFTCVPYRRISAILEQMIQAADVAHAMQAWPVFIKWNEKLYYELWSAKVHKRGPDCLDKWFDGQISFFDKYIFPLAERLKQCDVFGELGSSFYENANLNRERWMVEGQELCRKMHENASKLFGNGNQD